MQIGRADWMCCRWSRIEVDSICVCLVIYGTLVPIINRRKTERHPNAQPPVRSIDQEYYIQHIAQLSHCTGYICPFFYTCTICKSVRVRLTSVCLLALCIYYTLNSSINHYIHIYIYTLSKCVVLSLKRVHFRSPTTTHSSVILYKLIKVRIITNCRWSNTSTGKVCVIDDVLLGITQIKISIN